LLYIFDNCVLDANRRELRCGSLPVAIEPQVFDLLVHLIRHREHVVSRDELIESIWGGRVVSESALSTRINAVRGAIGDSGTGQRLIKTLPRKGVRFIGDVREEEKTSEAAPASGSESRAGEPIELQQGDAELPARQAVNSYPEALPRLVPAPRETRRFFPRAAMGAFAVLGLFCFAALTWSYFARSAQSERTRMNVETAARLTHISQSINMTSREDYETARALRQWAVDLALQDARLIAPENMRVRGAQCQILRAMRQFEAAIKACTELAQSFPDYAFSHKEIGYDKLMMGQPDEALAEFLEADRLSPDSQLRWSWQQGIGLIYLMQKQDQKAIEYLSRAALEAPNAGFPVAYLASAYALVGREPEAREALGHYLKLWPNTTSKSFGPTIGTAAFSSNMERVLEGLRLAGLPD